MKAPLPQYGKTVIDALKANETRTDLEPHAETGCRVLLQELARDGRFQPVSDNRPEDGSSLPINKDGRCTFMAECWHCACCMDSSFTFIFLHYFFSCFCCLFQSLFNRGLSSRIRHFRCRDKNKSAAAGQGATGAKTRPCFKPAMLRSSPMAQSVVSPEDAQLHVEELKKEWAKPEKNRNTNHIKLIIEQTTEHRAALLAKDETGRIAPIIDVYPCFEDGYFVSIHPVCHSITYTVSTVVSCVVVISIKEVGAIRFKLSSVVIQCKVCFLNL